MKCAERVSHGINPDRAQVEDTVDAKRGGAHMLKENGEKLRIQSKQAQHGFRFIQLPYNLAYSEALFLKNQRVGSQNNLTILEARKQTEHRSVHKYTIISKPIAKRHHP